ncbi:MAG: hypothetical protein ACYTFZ_08285, partial [Planctomycetota bacterium]
MTSFRKYTSSLLICLLVFFVLTTCATSDKTVAGSGEVQSPIKLKYLKPDRDAPQAAVSTPIRWTASARGGEGALIYEFRTLRRSEEVVEQVALSSTWDWVPKEAGIYRVKVIIGDTEGNSVESDWSSEYTVTPPLTMDALTSDRLPPQTAALTTIRWNAFASGGVGAPTYEFRTRKGDKEKVEQRGSSSTWDWTPGEAGTYRVKVVVRDRAGNEADSGWSSGYEIVPQLLVSALTPDKASPQVAGGSAVRWTAEAGGGVGILIYEFRSRKGDLERIEQIGPSSVWDWVARETGTYSVKVVVRDSTGTSVESAWSSDYEIIPELFVRSLRADKPPPQAAKMTTIRWTTDVTGGARPLTYEFRTWRGAEEVVEQEGPSPSWEWIPSEPGTFRVRVVVKDALGNTRSSSWSPEYEIVPELVVEALAFDKEPPQAAVMATIMWTVTAKGGLGAITYEFRSTDGKRERVEQKGPSPEWRWTPREAGTYRAKVIVRDAIGNTVESGWSPDYEIAPELVLQSLTPDRPAPQAARMATIRWSAVAAGGVGSLTYEFRISDGKEESVVQSGLSASWDWMPEEAGVYRVKVIVRDAIGNAVE